MSGIGSQAARRFGYLSGMQFWNSSIVCWALGGYGLQLTGTLDCNTKEDLGVNSQTIIMWGANLASQPTTGPHLIAARERGATVVAIDVRRTETARHADRMLVIRPGTDAALALGMLHVLVAEGLGDRAFTEAHTIGYEPIGSGASAVHPGMDGQRHRPGCRHDRAGWRAPYATAKPG